MLEDVLDSVKTTRYQLGTFSHMSEELDSTLDEIRPYVYETLDLLSRRGNAATVVASAILAVFAVTLVRGWFEAQRQWLERAAAIRGWIFR